MEKYTKKRTFSLLMVCAMVFQGHVYVQAGSSNVANNSQTKELKSPEKSCQCKKNDTPVDKAVFSSSDKEFLLKFGVTAAIAWMLLIYVTGPSGGPE